MAKTKICLIWDSEKGKFKRYLLNKALRQNNPREEHYILDLFLGYDK